MGVESAASGGCSHAAYVVCKKRPKLRARAAMHLAHGFGAIGFSECHPTNVLAWPTTTTHALFAVIRSPLVNNV